MIIMEENNSLQKSEASKFLTTTTQTYINNIPALFRNTIKVRDLSPDNKVWLKVRFALNQAAVIIGSQSILSDEEYFLMKDFLTTEYKDLSAEEILIAFKKLSAGKIQVEMQHFGKLSPMYLGAVLSAFKKYRHKQLAEDLKNQPKTELVVSDEEKAQIKKNFLENCLFKPYDQIKEKGCFDVDIHIAYQLWLIFRRAEIVSISEEEGNEYIEKAKDSLKADAKRDFNGHKPMQKHMEGVRGAMNGTDQNYADKIMNRGRALYMIDYMERLSYNNRDIRKIAERI